MFAGVIWSQRLAFCCFLFIKVFVFVLGFFLKWMEEQDKARADLGRALYAASVLKKNYLGRVFQAWRVVNQEECIIEPLAKRRERKEMARYVIGLLDLLG